MPGALLSPEVGVRFPGTRVTDGEISMDSGN